MNAGAAVVVFLGVILYNLAIIAGAVYLIAERDWSAWWMLAAVFLLAGGSKANSRGRP